MDPLVSFVVVACVISVPWGLALYYAVSTGAARQAVVEDLAADTAAERDEWKRRCEEADKDAEDAAKRGQAAFVKAREHGAALADPDDATAFAGVLQRQRERTAAAAAQAAARRSAKSTDPRPAGSVEA